MNKTRLIIFCFFTLPSLWVIGLVCFALVGLSANPQKPAQTTDAVVVLTGGQNRIDQGLILFAEGKASHLFISGVHPDVKEYEITRRWGGETSLPPCCISLGQDATTTIENADETAAWATDNDITSIRLVTSNYHMARAALELSAKMPDVRIIKHPIKQDDLNPSKRRVWELLFSEYHKYLLRRVQILMG